MRKPTPSNILEKQETNMDMLKVVHGNLSTIPLSALRLDGGTQPRAKIVDDIVASYAEELSDGNKLPPVVTYYDGTNYWLADGFHRAKAYESLGWTEIPAEVRQGEQRDAVLFSVGANATHGLRRTDEDKRRAVQRLLDDSEWSHWSDRTIADKCHVSPSFVGKCRAQRLSIDGIQIEKRSVVRNGATYTMSTAKIGTLPTWSDAEWRLYDWAVALPGKQGLFALTEAGQINVRSQKWNRINEIVGSLPKSETLSIIARVRNALQSGTIPDRDTRVPQPDIVLDPVVVERAGDGWVAKAVPEIKQPSHPATPAKNNASAYISEIKHLSDGRKIIVFVAERRETWIELSPERAIEIAKELERS